MNNIIGKYDDFIDYVAQGYAAEHSLSEDAAMQVFLRYDIARFLIDGYHPLARHNRRYISRKIDELIARKEQLA